MGKPLKPAWRETPILMYFDLGAMPDEMAKMQ